MLFQKHSLKVLLIILNLNLLEAKKKGLNVNELKKFLLTTDFSIIRILFKILYNIKETLVEIIR